MTDIELCDLGNGSDWLNVAIVQPVAGVDLHSQACRVSGRRFDPIQLPFDTLGVFGFRVTSGMNLHNRRPRLPGRVDLIAVRRDEQRHSDASLREPAARFAYVLELTHDV